MKINAARHHGISTDTMISQEIMKMANIRHYFISGGNKREKGIEILRLSLPETHNVYLSRGVAYKFSL